MSDEPKIIVIGAGAAGYAAACKLIENNFQNIQILEAQNRIGGRILSVDLGTGKVDLGAQWCHGEKDNIVYTLAKDLNVLAHSTWEYEEYNFVNSEGNNIDKKITDKLIQIMLSILNDNDGFKQATGNLGDFITKKYNEEVKKNYSDVDAIIAKQILEWYAKLECNLNGANSWYDISAKGFNFYKDCEGDLALNWKKFGYQTIFSILKKEVPDSSKKLPVDDKILLQKEVTQISWPNNQSEDEEVTVTCKDGSVYKADHVIVTISLAVLKECHKNLFVPQLPEKKQNSITGLSMDHVDKIFLKFPIQWWPKDCNGFSLIWTDADKQALLSNFPDGPSKNGKSWLECIFGFYPINDNPTILLGWYNGEMSPEIEVLPEDVVRRGCMYVLRKFLGKKYDIPEPEAVLRSTWGSNPHIRGSYSYRSMKTEEMNVCAEDLAEPLANNKLLFAGEATHPHFYSTVHGAIETGFREADRIISFYNELKSISKIHYKVIIVGAGISGLAAALTLLESGCKDILLLEAQSSAGGRIVTIPVNDSYVDLGAQWLHGDRNALWKISKEHDLISKQTIYEGRGIYVREDGYRFDSFLVEKVQFIVGQILEECERFIDEVDFPDSVGKYLDEKFTQYLKKSSLSKVEIEQYLELYDWNIRFQVIDNCCNSLYNVSAKLWGKYFCPIVEGQAHINYSKGHGSIIDVLVKKLPDNVLRTNCPVTNINWLENNENESVIISCKDGSCFLADTVIVTSSLGVLKHSYDLFTPVLPLSMTETVHAMGFASICKIFLLFEEKWWKWEGIQLIWKFDREYGDNWMRYLSGFDLVLDQECMLVGWVGGRGAEIVEHVPENEIGKKCGEMFREFMNDTQIPDPILTVRSTWSSNEWIRGGYCHTTPECDKNQMLPERLQEPVRNRFGHIKILLAGEHTHPEHFSTTHGAYESGIKQARTLLSEMSQ